MSTVRALALYQFQPSAEIELALKPGDIVVVTNKNAGDGWCEGELNGKRGLFPKGFVRLITFGKQDDDDDDNDETTDTNHTPTTPSNTTPTSLTPTSTTFPVAVSSSTPSKTPLTPMSTKKMFMETLLTPTPDTIKKVYNQDRVKELFNDDVIIGSGPKWKTRPPELTIAVQETVKGIRSSGVKLQKSYDVSTKELKVSVMRKYKHFLWLYDQLAEKFPCISLPPIPIKQSQILTSGPGFVEAQRRGLERFLNRVGKHPVLGCTRIFHLFLTAIDEKEWRIGTGKTSTLIRSSAAKNSRKLLSAPIYHSVQYPPYNVPINQLASFDKFSRFTSTVEVNLGNMQKACETLKNIHSQMGNFFRSFGKDIQNLAEGADQPSLGARYRKPSQGVVSLPNAQLGPNILPLATTTPTSDDDSDDEGTGREQIGEWNWREDETFTTMMTQLHDLGSCIRQLSQRSRRHQDQLTKGVIEAMEEYSGIVHTLPVLVKLHEDAMAMYNESKQKGSKTEAEDVRQDCETLNNILLAEFDYFSTQMMEDLQKVIMLLMKEEAEYHRKMASDWENMYTSYVENKPIRRTTVKRSTTLPGTIDDNVNPSSANSHQTTRPCSTDNKIDSSPTAGRRHYVNLPVLKKGNSFDSASANKDNPEEGGESSGIYENWSPTVTSGKITPTKASAVPLKKPIPPPLVVKRHELMSDQAEAERIGNKTDSFFVPSLVNANGEGNYTQVTLGKKLNNSTITSNREIKEELLSNEEEEVVMSPISNTSTIGDEDDESYSNYDPEGRRGTLTPSNVAGMKLTKQGNTASQQNIGITQSNGANTDKVPSNPFRRDIASKDSSNNRISEREREDSITSSSGQGNLMSKLAMLTQLPSRQDDSTTQDNGGVTKTTKSLIYQPTQGSPTNKFKLNSKTKGSFKGSYTSHSIDMGQTTELKTKLEKQRKRMEKQLSHGDSGTHPTSGGCSEDSLVLSTDDDTLYKTTKNSNSTSSTSTNTSSTLAKFGIVEDELSGTFIV